MAPGTSDAHSSSAPATQGLREQLSVMYHGFETLPETSPDDHDADDEEDEREVKVTRTTNKANDANRDNTSSSTNPNPTNGESETKPKNVDKTRTDALDGLTRYFDFPPWGRGKKKYPKSSPSLIPLKRRGPFIGFTRSFTTDDSGSDGHGPGRKKKKPAPRRKPQSPPLRKKNPLPTLGMLPECPIEIEEDESEELQKPGSSLAAAAAGGQEPRSTSSITASQDADAAAINYHIAALPTCAVKDASTAEKCASREKSGDEDVSSDDSELLIYEHGGRLVRFGHHTHNHGRKALDDVPDASAKTPSPTPPPPREPSRTTTTTTLSSPSPSSAAPAHLHLQLQRPPPPTSPSPVILSAARMRIFERTFRAIVFADFTSITHVMASVNGWVNKAAGEYGFSLEEARAALGVLHERKVVRVEGDTVFFNNA
ncbi:hypothetical protein N0V83_009999 [Neocucurbitaria cava]|uniref:Uncharacterized protein n=1 Tax=Neocucurbitaria cava TaxID=798079 RepID=A0A9W8XZX1_9PLEO|nr:hypothetical protein N0V83_009999 [Neocucurbitaria cava]